MSGFLQSRDRNVIPRWRSFRDTLRLGELGRVAKEPAELIQIRDLGSVSESWQRHRTPSFAGDLISAALVCRNLDAAREASEFVLSVGTEASTTLQALAHRVLQGNTSEHVDPIKNPLTSSATQAIDARQAIAGTRTRLRTHPSNSVLWMDLAYLYSVRGLLDKAERAVRIALSLAPANRFILRSAARFYIHRNRLDTAHEIIRRAPGLLGDPWLVSAEVAISLAAKQTPWHVKEGRALLNSGKFPMSHLSELSSALGTLEFNSGTNTRARKLFRQSLIAPNDNSLAQAQWISRTMGGLPDEINEVNSQVARAFEADAYRYFNGADWEGASNASLLWLGDQPFSSRPARLAAYIASSIFEDFKSAEEIANFGLKANPDYSGFHIDLAFCYANTGRLTEALHHLSKVIPGEENWTEAAIVANYGLVAFREGAPEVGRRFYEEAVKLAEPLSDKRTKIAALIHWSAEEAGLPDSNSERLYEEAIQATETLFAPDLETRLKRLRERIDSTKR